MDARAGGAAVRHDVDADATATPLELNIRNPHRVDLSTASPTQLNNLPDRWSDGRISAYRIAISRGVTPVEAERDLRQVFESPTDALAVRRQRTQALPRAVSDGGK
ncbi:MAG TPA: hypothetical protein VEU47_13790 [Candidatus Cybelea sp.]|nr:hypothetical protein [Candidatus Cybelea sp.]